MMDDDKVLLERMVDDLRTHEAPLHLAMAPLQAVHLAGIMQLSLRHPDLSENSRQAAEWFIAHVRAHFADCPGIIEVMRRGDDPRYDRRRSGK